jgi:hypothetical protein
MMLYYYSPHPHLACFFNLPRDMRPDLTPLSNEFVDRQTIVQLIREFVDGQTIDQLAREFRRTDDSLDN